MLKKVLSTFLVISMTCLVQGKPSLTGFVDSLIGEGFGGRKISSKEVLPFLVLIDCGEGTGSGFLAESNGFVYVYTNQHVIAHGETIKLKSFSGDVLEYKGWDYAAERDIIRFRVGRVSGTAPLRDKTGAVLDLPVMKGLEIGSELPSINEEIFVYGNSDGGGVATELKGKVLGVGPDKVEVSSSFVRGNSGSPILTNDMKVVGIATYVTQRNPNEKDWVNNNTRFTKVRRFGYRFDNVKWRTTSFKSFKDNCRRIQVVQESCKEIFEVAEIWSQRPLSTISLGKEYSMSLRKWASKHNLMVKVVKKLAAEDYSDVIPAGWYHGNTVNTRQRASVDVDRLNVARTKAVRYLKADWARFSKVCKNKMLFIKFTIDTHDDQLSKFQKNDLETASKALKVLAEAMEKVSKMNFLKS